MAALDIRPHSRRISGLVVLGLSILAVAAFASGLARQASSGAAAPFPVTQAASPGDAGLAVGAIPLATPAPELQVAEAAPVRHAPAKAPPAETPAPDADPAAAAPPPPAVDASATAAGPETPPAPAPQGPPNTDDPPN
jgi:hypothetical protein